MDKDLKVSSGKGRTEVTGEESVIGRDILVSNYGGSKPHIGAVAFSIPRKSLNNKNRTSSSTSVFTVTGHKDDEIAKAVAEKIASSMGKKTVVTAGIHIKKATGVEIKVIVREADRCADKIIKALSSGK